MTFATSREIDAPMPGAYWSRKLLTPSTVTIADSPTGVRAF